MRTERAIHLEIRRLRAILNSRRMPESKKALAFDKLLTLQWALGVGSRFVSPSALILGVEGRP